MTRLRITRRTEGPSRRRMATGFKDPAYRSGSFKPPAFRSVEGDRAIIKADQVRDIGRASGSLEADLINKQVSASRDPEKWEEVSWEAMTGTSGISRTTRMRRFVTTALRRLLGRG